MKTSKNLKIGLALGSGGFKGVAGHIGVLKELIKAKIPIDYIAGSSAGSLVGGIYASTKDIEKLEKTFLELKPKDYIPWFSDVTLTSGLIKGEKAIDFIKSMAGTVKIENCKIPFAAVTTNVDTGRTVVYQKGPLSEAIRASSSIPLLLQPVKIRKRWLIDGGNSAPVPVDIVRKMGADIVIAVNMNGQISKMPRKKTENGISFPKIQMISQGVSILLYNLAKENCKHADIVIVPNVLEFGWLNLGEYLGTEKPIKAGEDAAKKAIPHIKEKIEKWRSQRR